MSEDDTPTDPPATDPSEAPGKRNAGDRTGATGEADSTPVAEDQPFGRSGDPLAGPQSLQVLTVPYKIAQQGISIAVALLVFGGGGISALVGSGQTLVAVGVVAAIVVGAVAIVGYLVASYRRFEYELTDDTFDIRSGVFSRRKREIPLRRIQNVDISQNVVQRGLGIAEVGLETAGGGQTEAQLRYVDDERAELLQTEISRRSRAADAAERGATAETEAERFDQVFSITQRELGVLALISVDLRIASFLFFGASVFAPSAVSMFRPDSVWEYGLNAESILGAVLGPAAALAGVLVLALASGALNAARYHGFTLARGDEELRYERGLLQRYRGTIPLAKVQTLTVRENVLARLLGYAALTIETAGYTPTGGESNGSQSAVPVADRSRVVSLARSLEAFDASGFRRPPKRARLRYGFRYTGALSVVVAVFYVASVLTTLPLYWYMPLAAAPLVPVAAHLKWLHRGYAIGEDHVVTRNGFWVRKQKVVPYHRVQTVFTSQTVFQRRRDLATVTVDTAGSQSIVGDDAAAVDIDAAVADEVRERVSDELYGALVRRRRADPGPPRTGGSGRSSSHSADDSTSVSD